jgi:tmRNA-binding protein
MSIVDNKKAYRLFVEEKFEAGLALEAGVKAIRAGRAQLGKPWSSRAARSC